MKSSSSATVFGWWNEISARPSGSGTRLMPVSFSRDLVGRMVMTARFPKTASAAGGWRVDPRARLVSETIARLKSG